MDHGLKNAELFRRLEPESFIGLGSEIGERNIINLGSCFNKVRAALNVSIGILP